MIQHQLQKIKILSSALILLNVIGTYQPTLANTTPKDSTYITQRRPEEEFRIQLYEKAKPAVIQIRTDKGVGSGFIVTPNGLVITNMHVVDNAAKTVTAILSDGTQLTADIVGFHQNQDLALLKIRNQSKLPTLGLASPDSLKQGQSVYAIGSPFGLENTITSGILNRIERRDSSLQHDARINSGNSGGPLLDSQGQVIGINTAIFSRDNLNTAISIAISIDQVNSLLKAYSQGIPPFLTLEEYRNPQRITSLPTNGQPIVAKLQKGDRVTGKNTYYKYYAFEGKANQQITLEMTSQAIDSVLVLYLVTQNSQKETRVVQVARNEGISAQNSNAKIVIKLPENGTYLVEATTFQPGESGEYSLKATLN